ncbi:MAG TPA: hypothetical protein VES73_02235 [Lamprocystis sp. (in: g-proteobacteria)]|nr:hypothetical protein [Lamprocystis sp. (in: g-proteobacteria)]
MSKNSSHHTDREDRTFSAIIAEFVEGYMDPEEPRLEVRQNYVNVACIAWNIAELARQEHEKAIRAYLDLYRANNPGSLDSILTALETDIHALIDWKLKKFAAFQGTVMEARLSVVNGKFSLAVVSMPIRDT